MYKVILDNAETQKATLLRNKISRERKDNGTTKRNTIQQTARALLSRACCNNAPGPKIRANDDQGQRNKNGRTTEHILCSFCLPALHRPILRSAKEQQDSLRCAPSSQRGHGDQHLPVAFFLENGTKRNENGRANGTGNPVVHTVVHIAYN